MTESHATIWDKRFAENGWPTDPDPYLVELARPLPPGRGLDLGSGPGRNSLWLAAAGWSMTLVDVSKVGLEQAAAGAERMDVAVTTINADVGTWEPESEGFDLVIVANLHPGPDMLGAILARAAEALRTGGHLFVVGHHVSNLGHHGPPDPERLLTVERLRAIMPAQLNIEVLSERERSRIQGTAHPGASTGRVVLGWAVKPTHHEGAGL